MSKRNEPSESSSESAESPYDEVTAAFTVPPGMRRVDDLDDIDPTELSTTPLVLPNRSKLERRPEAARSADGPDAPDGAPTSRIAKRAESRTPTPITELGGEPPLPLTTPLDSEGVTETFEPPASSAPATRAFVDDDVDPPATALDRVSDIDDLEVARAHARRGSTDVGLLVLRVVVGLIAMAHGLQKLFGWWNGPGLNGFEDMLLHAENPALGFAPQSAHILAIIGAATETGAGLLLIVGLFTPLAAAGFLGVMILATTYRITLAGDYSFFARTGGVEYELLLVAAAAAIVLTGPGRLSLDSRWGWSRRPLWGSIALLVVGIAGAVAVWIVFNGVNPLNPPT